MQLYINEEAVNVQFDSEKTLIDVYRSIEEEAAKHTRYILECRVEDRDVSQEYLAKTSLDSVRSMQFWIGNSQAVLLRTARTMDHYLDQIGSALFYSEELRAEDIEELRNGMAWVKEFVESAAGMLQLDLSTFTVPMPDRPESDPIRDVLHSLGHETTALVAGEAKLERLLNGLRAIKAFTGRLVVRLHAASLTDEDIREGLDRLESELPDLARRIAQINESYQSGRDGDGVGQLDTVMSELDSHMPFLYAALDRLSQEQRQMQIVESDEKSLDDVASSLVSLLADLSTALEQNDVVAAGDILEYELAEQIERLSPAIQQLKKFLPEDVTEKQF